MVKSTGPANAEYLRGLVFGGKQNKVVRDQTKQLAGQSQRGWLASSRWAAAAQLALAVSLTSSQNDLRGMDIEDKNNILMKTNDAVITLQGVLEGKHDKDIDDTLNQHHIPREGWWSAFFRVVEGMAVMGRLAHNRLQPLEDDFESKEIDWS
ncbi:hypothetical protein C1H46_039277 [Malus baccata]|uniref:Uncharacterized protein n=1 Tax=Malus baccata TaxID=106549 RepID=A0A540KLX9_MALBA|nr:hypothetical protein C1H46_039277 [Malus baccata]